jgi:hypothetical protein
MTSVRRLLLGLSRKDGDGFIGHGEAAANADA